MTKQYAVKWSWVDQFNYCRTRISFFENEEEQQKFAFEKYNEENVYEVRQITETILRKD